MARFYRTLVSALLCRQSGCMSVVERPSGSVPYLRFGGGGDSTRNPRRLSLFQMPDPERKKGFPWMPVYIDDLLSLAAVLTTEQLGALMRLRAHAWRSEPPCSLPDSDARLSVISGLNGTWDASKDALREIFTPDGSGRLIDQTLLYRWNEQKAKHASYSKRGQMGGRPKAIEKLGESSAFRQLSPVSDLVVNNSRTEILEESKLQESSAFQEPRAKAWLEANPGKRLPLTFYKS